MDSVSSNDQEQQVFSKDDLVYTYKSFKTRSGSIPRQRGGQLFWFFF